MNNNSMQDLQWNKINKKSIPPHTPQQARAQSLSTLPSKNSEQKYNTQNQLYPNSQFFSPIKNDTSSLAELKSQKQFKKNINNFQEKGTALSSHKVEINLNKNNKIKINQHYLSDNLQSSQQQQQQLYPQLRQQSSKQSVHCSVNNENSTQTQNSNSTKSNKSESITTNPTANIIKTAITNVPPKASNILHNENQKCSSESESESEDLSDSDSDDSDFIKAYNKSIMNMIKLIDQTLLKKEFQRNKEMQQKQMQLKKQNEKESQENVKKVQLKKELKKFALQKEKQWQSDKQQLPIQYLNPSQRVPKASNIFSFGQKQQSLPIIDKKFEQIERVQHRQLPRKSQPIVTNKPQFASPSSNKQQQSFINLALTLKSALNPTIITQFEQNMVKYAKSAPTFVVGPRRQMLTFIHNMAQNVRRARNNTKIEVNIHMQDKNKTKVMREAGEKMYAFLTMTKIQEIREIKQKYWTNYFNLPQRNQIFGDIREMIKIYKEFN